MLSLGKKLFFVLLVYEFFGFDSSLYEAIACNGVMWSSFEIGAL
jgi:hypothetical protein